MKTESEIREHIKELELDLIQWDFDEYPAPHKLIRAKIWGLKYCLGEDYKIMPEGREYIV